MESCLYLVLLEVKEHFRGLSDLDCPREIGIKADKVKNELLKGINIISNFVHDKVYVI